MADKKKKSSNSRKAVSRMTFRFRPEETARLHSAVSKTADPWKGMSYHCRAALMTWADAMLSPAADARMRPVGKRKAS
jgi:hypothetical protein